MSAILTVFCLNLALVLGVFVVLWLVSLALRDASIVDPCWGAGFVLVAWHTRMMLEQPSTRAWLMLVIVTLWGLRLSAYLTWRNWGHGEDRRYQAMREKHGSRFWLVSLGTVFMLQAVLMWLISWPVQTAIISDESLGILDYLGAGLSLLGIVYESLADFQLARFKSNSANKDHVLDTGLWRYSRHPNYFGEFCTWWGIYLVALGGGGWWTVIGPLTISFLLLKVSGVTLLESTITHRRPEYREYIERTNAFFPGPRRS